MELSVVLDEMMIIFIGVIVATFAGAIAKIIIYKLKKFRDFLRDSLDHKKNRDKIKKINKSIKILTILMYILFIIAIIFLILIISIWFSPPSFEITITDPIDGDSVELIYFVRGTAQGIPEDKELWIVVYCTSIGQYYPQDGSVEPNDIGEWEFRTYIGQENNSGLDFEIKVVLADSLAQDIFNNYIAESETKEEWEGINNIPEGAKTYAYVQVTRE